jgi:hypothetical protein
MNDESLSSFERSSFERSSFERSSFERSWKIEKLRGQLVDLGSAIRQLQQSGLDSASAQLLISRKRAELEDLMNQARQIRQPSE